RDRAQEVPQPLGVLEHQLAALHAPEERAAHRLHDVLGPDAAPQRDREPPLGHVVQERPVVLPEAPHRARVARPQPGRERLPVVGCHALPTRLTGSPRFGYARRMSIPRRLVLFAPGAGAPSSSPWMARWAERLAAHGRVATFDYPYMLAGRRMPDKLPVL